VYCNNCGKNNPTGSKFCNFCGANLTRRGSTNQLPELASAAPEPTLPAKISDEEKIIFTAQPTMIFVIARYIAAAILTLIVTVISAFLHSRFQISFAPLIALVFGLLIFLNPIYHHILRQREVYTLTNHKIEFTYGLLSKTTRNIPLSKIQDVTATSSALERLLGIGDVLIDSAADSGKIPLRKVSNPKSLSDMILNEARQRD
jgi:membrane protein YdbS with pleckstrin-like domain